MKNKNSFLLSLFLIFYTNKNITNNNENIIKIKLPNGKFIEVITERLNSPIAIISQNLNDVTINGQEINNNLNKKNNKNNNLNKNIENKSFIKKIIFSKFAFYSYGLGTIYLINLKKDLFISILNFGFNNTKKTITFFINYFKKLKRKD